MDDELNVTYVTLGGHVEVEKYRYVYFVIMFTVYILIICSNFTIVCLIWVHQNLHEPMYIFIAALLLNSVLISTAIYPKLLIDFLSEKQIITHSACLFQYYVYYTSGGAEFLLLAAMSYDRYVCICKPLQYPTIMTKKTVSIFLLSAWILPACQVAVPSGLLANKKLCSFTLKGVYCNNTLYTLQCVVSTTETILDMVILLNIAVVPVFFILFTYTTILTITHRRGREVRKKAAQTCIPHLIVLINFSCMCAYDVITVRLESDFPKIVRSVMSLQTVMYHPLFNPIMYGLKVTEICQHLKKLFCQAKIV